MRGRARTGPGRGGCGSAAERSPAASPAAAAVRAPASKFSASDFRNNPERALDVGIRYRRVLCRARP